MRTGHSVSHRALPQTTCLRRSITPFVDDLGIPGSLFENNPMPGARRPPFDAASNAHTTGLQALPDVCYLQALDVESQILRKLTHQALHGKK